MWAPEWDWKLFRGDNFERLWRRWSRSKNKKKMFLWMSLGLDPPPMWSKTRLIMNEETAAAVARVKMQISKPKYNLRRTSFKIPSNSKSLRLLPFLGNRLCDLLLFGRARQWTSHDVVLFTVCDANFGLWNAGEQREMEKVLLESFVVFPPHAINSH